MNNTKNAATNSPNIDKFSRQKVTATGEPRASIKMTSLKTLWINTGTVCNLTCLNCYIESSPKNDRLSYITFKEVSQYLQEIKNNNLNTKEIGFTGGEPFMNPDIIKMLKESLSFKFRVIVLTNAMRPMMKHSKDLLCIKNISSNKLTFRVSLDHYTKKLHEEERGINTWEPALSGIKWLLDNGFQVNFAGRNKWGENDTEIHTGYRQLFKKLKFDGDPSDPATLTLFPEMDTSSEVPEITTSCWGILDVDPSSIMCASSRMIIKKKGEEHPTVQACTLLPYDNKFSLGKKLVEADKNVFLNHLHCAKFCVLGGGSCSS